MSLSVAIITKNEEANIRRTLESVKWADEIVVVDSGSTDRTCDIAREYGAKVFVEEWKGFAKQKNSAIEKCSGDWILSLDADEEVSSGLHDALRIDGFLGEFAGAVPEKSDLLSEHKTLVAIRLARKNHFLGRWIKHGGFYPDHKVRIFRKDLASFRDFRVHETLQVKGGKVYDFNWGVDGLDISLIHHAYPTLSGYIEHMNRYSDLGAQMVAEKGKVGFSFVNIVIRPIATFIYNYFLRLGFLDGREGLLLHLYHSVYVSWKYAKAWELSSSGERSGERDTKK
ncbi:MAG: glycosyltransferase family 2 protein [Terriglobales bacterium]